MWKIGDLKQRKNCKIIMSESVKTQQVYGYENLM